MVKLDCEQERGETFFTSYIFQSLNREGHHVDMETQCPSQTFPIAILQLLSVYLDKRIRDTFAITSSLIIEVGFSRNRYLTKLKINE